MYVRVTTVQGSPSGIDDVVALVRDRAKPIVDSSEDGRGMSVFVDRKGGRVVAASAWETESARDASNAQLAPVRDEAARLMKGTVHVAEYAVAVSEQVTAPAPGCWARSTALATGRDGLRDGITDFQATVIPALRDVPGFCGATLLVDPASGRAVGTSIWSSQDALAATRSMASGLRARVAARTRGQVTGVSEYEVVLADIKAPRHEHLFRRAYEIMSTGDPAELDAIIAPGLIEHAPIPPGFPSGGREGVKAFMTEFRTGFPDLRMTIEKYLEQGDLGCAVLRVTGTNTGPFMGQSPTGKAIDISMVDVVRIVDGQAVEHWGGSDDLGMLTQLGLADGAGAIPAQTPRTIELEPRVQA